jgi:hypothetical protein
VTLDFSGVEGVLKLRTDDVFKGENGIFKDHLYFERERNIFLLKYNMFRQSIGNFIRGKELHISASVSGGK